MLYDFWRFLSNGINEETICIGPDSDTRFWYISYCIGILKPFSY